MSEHYVNNTRREAMRKPRPPQALKDMHEAFDELHENGKRGDGFWVEKQSDEKYHVKGPYARTDEAR